MARKAAEKAEKSADTVGATGAGKPEKPQNALPGTSQDSGVAGGGGDPALSAIHTQGGNGAGQPADTPHGPAEGHTAGPGGEAVSLPADISGALGNDPAPAAGAGGAGGPDDSAVARQRGWPKRIRVIGPEKGRRRAGMRFGAEPTDLDVSDLTPEALAALDADPALMITSAEN